MDAWADIRLVARETHTQALEHSGGDRTATALIAAALAPYDLQIRYFDSGEVVDDVVLGFLERESLLVNVRRGQSPADEAAVVAHEIGHFHLHLDPRSEVTAVAEGLGGDPVESGAGRVEGYSARERKEIQADIFAGEFLCPTDWLKVELVERNRKPSEIAQELGLPPSMVLHQTIRALLLPPLRPPEPEEDTAAVLLDSSQDEAANWNAGPLLVEAGPGTGKTRTLVHRIMGLLEEGALPGSILALTFSKKAAEEMRERLSKRNRDAAIEMWVGTFHAFGLEMVTKWPSRVQRTEKVRILDETGSLALLERNLERLPLRHYQNLYEPAYELVHVVKAIARCKDELIGWEEYLTEAKATLAAASDEERENAEKAVEIGEIYRIYEEALVAEDAVDFGDLIRLPIQLLADEEIREAYQSRFEHILVDEYQDVNYASAQLLRALAGSCEDVWVVCDQRQSIYRFRGAKPENVARFEKEFGGTRRSLGHNYRSGGPVVRAFAEFSRHMGGSNGGGTWDAHRGEVGEISLSISSTVAGEAGVIRDTIEALRTKGVAYRDQCILARSHLTLARITDTLERLGIPLLYMGDLFERDEIRDLLSLVALDAEFGGIGLVRLAQLPEYGASRQDAVALLVWAQEQKLTVFNALTRTDEVEGLSPAGRAGLARLGEQLAGMEPETTPWNLLTTWLFERSDYLRPLVLANDAKSQQRLIAIYQLLKVCGEHLAMGDTSRRRFVERVRRIEALNHDTAYRAVASEASDFDAVRVMTIHGSKGLEFRAVHLPGLATTYMPANRQWVRCPPPPALAQLALRKEDHDAEEECLFFVAMSRARDYLCLSRAERYTQKRNSSESRFLAIVAPRLQPKRSDGELPLPVTEPVMRPPAPRDSYSERELDIYLRCPARYDYEVIHGLRGGGDASAYLRFHRCVYRTLGWLEARATEGRPADLTAAQAELARQWEEAGPVDHGFEAYYRAIAGEMVGAIATLILGERGRYDRSEWSVELDGKHITFTPDRVILEADGTVRVQRVRTGRKTKSEHENGIYALIRRGAEQRYPGRPLVVETFYPATGEAVPVSPAKNDEKLLQEYRDAIAGIERGAFAPEPDPRKCPNCQCYFVCGA
ncbi:MAG: UvrD-helicase domain-containing protein [Alphaproteobacteria bacterium]|nr:UvrD-helicase domain-containing protein [Alphaproteobacteria bacterium]MBV9371032.1 UvrD-helicase domain-containing protein [Alphaproteobacteria bacterium]MBV9901594.1 UvrD-helicase domain-containing protein [Alphaproteobacteria bacterium]